MDSYYKFMMISNPRDIGIHLRTEVCFEGIFRGIYEVHDIKHRMVRGEKNKRNAEEGGYHLERRDLSNKEEYSEQEREKTETENHLWQLRILLFKRASSEAIEEIKKKVQDQWEEQNMFYFENIPLKGEE